MANKTFVSYKYADSDVYPLKTEDIEPTTVRSYVDMIESYFETHTQIIYKGESDDEDLSEFSEDYIWKKLKTRIYDSSVTIVMISPNMKEPRRGEKSQWIPWEISYSLKEKERSDRVSHSNAILAIVLPDKTNSYDYFIQDNTCCNCICRTFRTDILFNILKDNMFNQRQKAQAHCDKGNAVYSGECSYIKSVKWDDFVKTPQLYIDKSIEIKKKY
ncbi:TIR domain-containing protein [Treponema endosymbiont of Eucomonympha sp.]|uniref:TIR domain-containing protein n=1 Tax=Treponema endosymbiont of Eucomonympha sp. TaxID=1580831 RepID=UPI000AD82566|nr:TIR domain-containing protein [Treponema endosymbiont of Eucomonympha sp.]